MPRRKVRDARASKTTDQDSSTKAMFEPFRWTDPKSDTLQIEARPLNQLIEKVIDVTDGVRAVMCVLEQDDYRDHDDAPPLLDSVRQGALRRLGITSLLLLSDEATRLGDWVQEHQQREALDLRHGHKRRLPKQKSRQISR